MGTRLFEPILMDTLSASELPSVASIVAAMLVIKSASCRMPSFPLKPHPPTNPATRLNAA